MNVNFSIKLTDFLEDMYKIIDHPLMRDDTGSHIVEVNLNGPEFDILRTSPIYSEFKLAGGPENFIERVARNGSFISRIRPKRRMSRHCMYKYNSTLISVHLIHSIFVMSITLSPPNTNCGAELI